MDTYVHTYICLRAHRKDISHRCDPISSEHLVASSARGPRRSEARAEVTVRHISERQLVINTCNAMQQPSSQRALARCVRSLASAVGTHGFLPSLLIYNRALQLDLGAGHLRSDLVDFSGPGLPRSTSFALQNLIFKR